MVFFEPGAPVIGESESNESFGFWVVLDHGIYEMLSESVALSFS